MSPSAFALMRVASASASAARRVACARAAASILVRSAVALAAAMTEYASASDSAYIQGEKGELLLIAWFFGEEDGHVRCEIGP